MKTIIFGVKGMLGSDLLNVCEKNGIEAIGYDLPELDLSDSNADLESLPSCDWVINCAAYTNVDGAEGDFDTAMAVNSTAAGIIARFCKQRDVPMVHISTDYVFDGTKTTPYSEKDEVKPINAYGRSKLAGEELVYNIWNKHIIVRTQSLFGLNGKNFIKAICERIESGQPLKVVDDQVSCPTFTHDLSDAIIRLLYVSRYGTVNVSSEGACSWHEFACAIVDVVKPGTEVRAVGSVEFPMPAKRPAYSVLSKKRYEEWTGAKMPSWQDALRRYLETK